jgi:ATP-dependent RNA helicase HelY
LHDVLADDALSAGDFVRTMKQLIDLVRQIEKVLVDAADIEQAQQASERLYRGVVALASTIEGGRA